MYDQKALLGHALLAAALADRLYKALLLTCLLAAHMSCSHALLAADI